MNKDRLTKEELAKEERYRNELRLSFLIRIEKLLIQGLLNEAIQEAQTALENLEYWSFCRMAFGTEEVGSPTLYDKRLHSAFSFGRIQSGDPVVYCLPAMYDKEGKLRHKPYVCRVPTQAQESESTEGSGHAV